MQTTKNKYDWKWLKKSSKLMNGEHSFNYLLVEAVKSTTMPFGGEMPWIKS